ncbi:MAG: phosphoribosyltransferase family protein [Patescibacteria group bacterium]
MSIGGLTHPHCQSPHAADGLISIFDYTDEKVADILIKGKYSFLPDVYKELAALMAKRIKTDFPFLVANSCELAYVPLHTWRQRWRGFNQSKILGEILGKELNLPVVDVLQRKKFTKTQKNLKKEKRIKNVDSAFSLSPLFGKKGVRGGSFILIDDVTTTGSTLSEAVRVLKRNGAQKVICITVARD